MPGIRKEYKNLSNVDRQHSRILLLDSDGELLPDYTASTVEPDHYIHLMFRPGFEIQPLTGVSYSWGKHDIPAVAQLTEYKRYSNKAVSVPGNIFLRDKGRCYLTDYDFINPSVSLLYPDELTIDHVIPLAAGGRDKDMRNMALSHAHVNLIKGDMSVAEFQKAIDYIHLMTTDDQNHPLFIRQDIPDQMPEPKIEDLFLELWDNYQHVCDPTWMEFVDIDNLHKKQAEQNFANRAIRHHTLQPTG